VEEIFMKKQATDTGAVLQLSGELVFIDSQDFMREAALRVEDDGPNIVFDMAGLKFIDSAGLGAILYLSEALRMRGQKLEIRNANDNNKKLLKTIQNVGTFTVTD
jgi:anti-anti-sigma factor